MVVWQFDYVSQQLRILDQRLLEQNVSARCEKLQILPYIPELPSAAGSTSGNPMSSMDTSEKFKFVTEHTQDREQKTFLQFWTYEFNLKDLFLDKSILFDCPISILHGCPNLTNFLYVQRQSFEKEVLIYNQQADLIDKIDQEEEITFIKGYQDSLVILATANNNLIFYDLKKKKHMRVCNKLTTVKNKSIKSIQLYSKESNADTALVEMSDSSHILLDLDQEVIVANLRGRMASKIIHQEWLPIVSSKGQHHSYFI